MQEELKWFATAVKELSKFRGKHIAIIKNKVVASGNKAIDVLEKARREYPNEKPVLAFVPREETLVLFIKNGVSVSKRKVSIIRSNIKANY